MQLTPAQRLTLKTAIEAEPTLITPRANGDDVAVANWCNAATAFIVWRTRVDVDEIMSNGFVWTEVDALTAGKARIWSWMSQLGAINPSRPNVRQGLRDCFETNAPLTLGNAATGVGGLQPHLRRPANNAERVLATGTGTVPAPGQMGAEGTVSVSEVAQILRG